MIGTFNIDTFSEGDVFKVFYGDNQHIEITLVKAELSKYKHESMAREPFSWTFKCDKEILIEAGCHSMEQDKVGKFEMTINPIVTPIGESEHNFYEAIFS